jgi:gluconate kinase
MLDMNVLITGVAGSGKSTIAAELTKRSYTAYNTDSIKGLCAWVELATGKPNPNFERNSAKDWADKFDWLWNEDRLHQLLNDSGTKTIFFCGSSGNQDRLYSLFDKIFLLEVDDQLIRERILNSHREHDYGRKPGELDLILSYYKNFQNKAISAGAIDMDARKPVDEIVNKTLSYTVDIE